MTPSTAASPEATAAILARDLGVLGRPGLPSGLVDRREVVGDVMGRACIQHGPDSIGRQGSVMDMGRRRREGSYVGGLAARLARDLLPPAPTDVHLPGRMALLTRCVSYLEDRFEETMSAKP